MRQETIDNPRFPHHIRIVRKIAGDWLDDTNATDTAGADGLREVVVYEGSGRSYTDTTTVGDAKVDTNKRKCSIPVRFDEWPWNTDGDASDMTDVLVPMSGDLVYAMKGNVSEEWEVRDFEPDNNRSVVYGEHNRNLNIEG